MSSAAAPKKPFPPGMPIAEGDVIAGKYRVEGMVAVGGMGVVVSATHLALGQIVAIKVLLPLEANDDSSSAIPRFLREARAAAALKSEHVVRIFDVDTLPSGLPYMVMELLSGQDLRRVVKLGGPLPVERAVDFVLQAADAIGEAHAAGIVHRDLKPSNLFLTQRTDGRPWVKVLDFGISKASHDPLTDTALTVSRAMIGSPMYMSPEQVRDAKSVDGRSDIWSLGVILHELLSGKSAFRGESLPAICAAIAADQPESLAQARPDLPPELLAIAARCLEKDPARRFQTVDELRGALLPFLGRDAPTLTLPGRRSGDGASSTAAARLPPPSGRVPLGSSETIDVASSLVGSGAAQPPISVRVDGPFERSDPDAPTVLRDAVAAPRAASDAPLSKTRGAAGRRSRLPLVLGATAVVLLGALAIAVTSLDPPPKRAAVDPSTPAKAPAFSLVIESVPSSAEVFEADRVLGKTPLTIEVERSSVGSGPREFTLKLAAHQPYRIQQGDSAVDVTVRAPLVPEVATAPAAPEAPASASAPGRPRPTAAKPGPKKLDPTSIKPDPTSKPGTDIRLSR